MKTRKTSGDERRGPADWRGMFWCAAREAADRGAGASAMCDCSSVVRGCAAMCWWFPLVPLVVGIALLGLGYYLDASITRVLWMCTAGFVALLGLVGLILVGTLKTMCGGRG